MVKLSILSSCSTACHLVRVRFDTRALHVRRDTLLETKALACETKENGSVLFSAC